MTLLLERLPEHVQLALGTRADPPLPLARLRARGLLAEIRATDLQFTTAEMVAFLRKRLQTPLTPEALTLLHDWTEGWAAGLQLVTLALPGTLDGTATLDWIRDRCRDSQRHIFTYLAAEVFAQQPPALQTFLLTTSVLDDLTPELCDALRKDEGGRMKDEATAAGDQPEPFILHPSSFILDQLEQANLFLIRLDPAHPHYRYQQLFRDFLRDRLTAQLPERGAELHRRAARWYAAAGSPVGAVNHALAAGDVAFGADQIVQRAWEQLSARGEIATILAWAEQFTPGQLAAAPGLCLVFARAAYLAEQTATMERCFALAEQGLDRGPPDAVTSATRATLLTYRAAVAALDGSLARASAWLASAKPALRLEDDCEWAAHASAVGVCHYLRGDLPAARAAFDHMAEAARRASHAYLAADAVQLQALVDLAAGQLGAAEWRCLALLATFDGELPAIPALGLVLARLGAVAYHRGRLDEAEQLLRRGAELGRRGLGRADRQIWPWLVRVAAARHDRPGLRALLDAETAQSAARGGVVLASLGMAGRATALLVLGALDEAWDWASRCERLPGEHLRETEMVVVARVLLAQRRPEEALARLEHLVAETERGGRAGRLLEGLVVQARALQELGRLSEALAALRRALALAEPEGATCVFLDEGPPLFTLLRQIRAEGAPVALVEQLLAAGVQPRGGAAHPADALTEREREVLRLLAQGATNQEIAATLVVGIGTIKTHLVHILGKLDARNRTEAVARARALGLLESTF